MLSTYVCSMPTYCLFSNGKGNLYFHTGSKQLHRWTTLPTRPIFLGNMTCKIKHGGQYVLAYATPDKQKVINVFLAYYRIPWNHFLTFFKKKSFSDCGISTKSKREKRPVVTVRYRHGRFRITGCQFETKRDRSGL